jgi:hypothetical protein
MKSLIVILAIVFMGHQSQAQRWLKITKEKMETYNSYLRDWTGWPGAYSYFGEGYEPVLKITNLDTQGTDFLVSYVYNNSTSNLTVTYDGYDANNNWYKYTDVNGDQICIVGATMSSLAQNGWPGNHVQIYLWVYSEDYALLYE